MTKSSGVAVVAVALLATGCSGAAPDEEPATTVPPVTLATSPQQTTGAPPVTTAPAGTTAPRDPVVPDELVDFGFDFAAVTVGSRRLEPVAVADDPTERARGLMFVTDMGDVAGMLFIYGEMRVGSFWMKNTLIPLDIAFFDSEGALVDKFTMEPCPDLGDDCPRYTPQGAFQYALEAPAGALDWVSFADRLVPP